MSKEDQHVTAPEDRIPLGQKLSYGLGAFTNNLLADAYGRMSIVLNLGLGMSPALAGLVTSLPRIVDAITDPLMGYTSDNTRSRWGRRRPYIFIGAILVGIVFALMWQFPEGKSEMYYFWYFLGASIVFFIAYTIFITPWVALGYEMTPDYHERTRLMGMQNFIGQITYMVTPWLLAIMADKTWFDSLVDGAASLGVIIGVIVIAVGLLPAIFIRERMTPDNSPLPEAAASTEPRESFLTALGRNMRSFIAGFATSLKFKPFLKLCIATFLVFNGFMLISSFQSYVIIYYIFAGDTELGGKWVGISGTVQAFSSFLVIVLVTQVATRFGKRKTFFAAIGLSMIGYALKWFCYNPDIPWLLVLPAPLMAFGLGALFTLMPSMVADVVDADELNTHERREGMYGSIFWWVVKLGVAAALAAGGVLLQATGFDEALGGAQAERTLTLLRFFDAFIPVVTSAIAIYAIATFSITEERAHEIRAELEARRGAGDAAAAT
ncbi:MAG: MFS transporter [Pseudomonadota bacterium]